MIQIPLEQIYSCDITAVIGSEKNNRRTNSFDHVRANESTVDIVAISTQFSDSPLLATTSELRTIDDPAGNRGSAFCTRKKMLLQMIFLKRPQAAIKPRLLF